jgi:hypothetical protein
VPTKKQRKRLEKERRHEYETVWVDAEGNELDEPPEDTPAPARERRSDGKTTPQKRPQQRGARPTRQPAPPSWRRAVKRSVLLGVVVFAFMYIANGKTTGAARIVTAATVTALYTAIFIPFTYYVDRFTYRRWERNQPKKR